MSDKMIKAFEVAASKTVANLKNSPFQTQKEAVQKIAHQFMLNEFGFNYLLEMEFNDDIFAIFQEFQRYPQKLSEDL